jgi:hypothetical protein
MSLLGSHPNMGHYQRDAWEKGIRLFPSQFAFNVWEWIPGGLVELELDGTTIGRHLGPEISAFPLWGSRRSIGISEEGLVIPYDHSELVESLKPIQVPWSSIQHGYDSTHFVLTTEVIVTLVLTEDAAVKVGKQLEARRG